MQNRQTEKPIEPFGYAIDEMGHMSEEDAQVVSNLIAKWILRRLDQSQVQKPRPLKILKFDNAGS